MDGDVPTTRPSYSLSATWTFGTQAAIAVLALGNVLIVSRWLGPQGRGDVAFLTTVAYLSSQIGSLSIDQAAANVVGRNPELRRAVAGTILVLSLALGAVVIIVLGGLLAAFPGAGPRVSLTLRALALAAIPEMIFASYLVRIVFAEFAVRVVNIATLVPSVVNVGVNAAFAFTGVLTVTSAFSVWVAGQFLAVVLLAWYLQARLAGFGKPSVSLARDLTVFGLKSFGGRTLQLGNYRLDQWLVGALAGSRNLGLYSVAVAWSEGLFILPRALAEAQRPYIVRSERRDAGAQASAVVRFTILLTAPGALAVVVLAPFLCKTIFGPQFQGSVTSLQVLALGAFGISAMKILGSALIAQGKPLLDGLATAVAFLATVALDLALIPHHAGLGASIASSVAYAAGGIAVAVIAARTLGFPLRSLVPTLRDAREVGRTGTRLLRGRPSVAR